MILTGNLKHYTPLGVTHATLKPNCLIDCSTPRGGSHLQTIARASDQLIERWRQKDSNDEA